MALFLLTGPPGLRKEAVVEKLRVFLAQHGVTVGVGDVESELKPLLAGRSFVPKRGVDPLVTLIGSHPQDRVRQLWPDAFRAAVTKARSANPTVAIVVARLEYYRSETYEFYSPVDYATVAAAKPTQILTLIDDIFDVFYRLSRPGHVFDIRLQVERAAPTKTSATPSLRRLYRDAIELTIASLLRVLTWREREISKGASLAGAVPQPCPHAVLALKHPVETGVRVLLGQFSAATPLGESFPFYVSHPISRPRGQNSETGSWPAFVGELAHFVGAVSQPETDGRVHLVPVMPTAIDEYRFLSDGEALQPWLRPRWPLPAGELLYCLPDPGTSYEHFERQNLSTIFDPPLDRHGRRATLPLGDLEVSGMLRTLEKAIALQMSGRDHLLVRQCPGLLLYRPAYDEFRFSGGVINELHTFDQIRKLEAGGGAGRLVAFFHDRGEAEGLLRDPVIRGQVKSGLHAAVDTLASGLPGVTARPEPPEDAALERVLRVFADPAQQLEELHKQMWPPKTGSIGREEPLAWEIARDTLIRETERQRTLSLANRLEGHFLYRCVPAVGAHHEVACASPDGYVEVVDSFATNVVRTAAAGRARGFVENHVAVPALRGRIQPSGHHPDGGSGGPTA
ncbi:MAG: hypothetical protein JW741_09495 [Sedimentisphaerales bacterium]|nr:hypothetical protein [Sedimentisphaerales bacterium]